MDQTSTGDPAEPGAAPAGAQSGGGEPAALSGGGEPTAGPAGNPGYPGYPGYPAYQIRRPTNSTAIAALVTSLVALLGCQLVGVVAIYLANRARTEIRASGEEGDGLATAGLIIGWIAVGLGVLTLLVLLAYVGFIGAMLAGAASAN
ncbi:DUF4190 domain-containing protein [Plantactinospora sp. CA-290183]|uniref:DUF4190 domain-containing protein n=1 Tax=Plantactinospora sp. CA-290183 TaxID=3240006 RepID=UPI003D936B86